MKKIISIVCMLALVFGAISAAAVTASAAEPAQTAIKVDKGDEITYTLTLGGVAEPIVGCDFSVYYDEDIFDKVSIADFNDSTDQDEWVAMINPDLDGEIRGNWSILSGVDFSKDRHFLTVKLKAASAGTGHVSYFIRYLYDNNIFNSDDRPQITEYKFTCDVLKNGEPVIESAQPELNTSEEQKTGLFVNSVTGDSDDADADIPGTVVKKNNTNSKISAVGNKEDKDDNSVVEEKNNADNNGAEVNDADNVENVNENANDNNDGANNENAGDNNGNAENDAAEQKDNDQSADGKEADAKDDAPEETAAVNNEVKATAADSAITSTTADKEVQPVAENTSQGAGDNNGTSPVIWIIIALVVLGGGGVAAYFYMKKKPSDKDDDSNDDPDSETDE